MCVKIYVPKLIVRGVIGSNSPDYFVMESTCTHHYNNIKSVYRYMYVLLPVLPLHKLGTEDIHVNLYIYMDKSIILYIFYIWIWILYNVRHIELLSSTFELLFLFSLSAYCYVPHLVYTICVYISKLWIFQTQIFMDIDNVCRSIYIHVTLINALWAELWSSKHVEIKCVLLVFNMSRSSNWTIYIYANGLFITQPIWNKSR